MMNTKVKITIAVGLVASTCIAVGVLPDIVSTHKRSTRTFLDKAYEVLDSPKWYENDPFLVQEPINGRLPEHPPKWGPAAIDGREFSCILGVVNEFMRNSEVRVRLKKYTEHHNRKVAIQSVAALVRGKEWSKESAIAFAEEREWKPAEIQQMARLSRTYVEAAYDVLDNPRWHENDPLMRPAHSVDGTIKEAERMRVKTAIVRKEREAIIAVFSEYTRNPEVVVAVTERLKEYAEHHNPTVAVYSVAALVRYSKWTKKKAIEFAEEHRWTQANIDIMQRILGDSE